MARGASKRFSAYRNNEGLGAYNNSTNEFRWVIVTDDFTAIDANATSANLADFTQVASAGAYTANSVVANTTWAQSGDTCTLDGDNLSFAADPSNPTTGKSILIYNATVSNAALKVVDITVDDGVTAADTTQGLTYTVATEGYVYSQVNV